VVDQHRLFGLHLHQRGERTAMARHASRVGQRRLHDPTRDLVPESQSARREFEDPAAFGRLEIADIVNDAHQ
jgi:hypothetical protein